MPDSLPVQMSQRFMLTPADWNYGLNIPVECLRRPFPICAGGPPWLRYAEYDRSQVSSLTASVVVSNHVHELGHDVKFYLNGSWSGAWQRVSVKEYRHVWLSAIQSSGDDYWAADEIFNRWFRGKFMLYANGCCDGGFDANIYMGDAPADYGVPNAVTNKDGENVTESSTTADASPGFVGVVSICEPRRVLMVVAGGLVANVWSMGGSGFSIRAEAGGIFGVNLSDSLALEGSRQIHDGATTVTVTFS